MNHSFAVLLLAVGSSFAACNNSPSVDNQLITGDHPAPVDTVITLDTSATRPRTTVPFVNPTKAGRVLGSQSPSPPASRTR